MRNRFTNELAVCGYNAVKALADIHPERINRLFFREELLKDFSKACKLLAKEKRPYKACLDEELEHLCKSPRHQGVVAMMVAPEVGDLTPEDFAAWCDKGERILILDSVGNDNNLGAIVRSAAFFGVHRIILSAADEQAQLTTSAYRVAEGGMEHVVFRRVSDMKRFLNDARKSAIVIGADHRARNKLKELPALIRERAVSEFGAVSTTRGLGASLAVAVIVGNEEHGLSKDAKEACSLLVRIPGTGDIESLNVAQAATLFLHELSE